MPIMPLRCLLLSSVALGLFGMGSAGCAAASRPHPSSAEGREALDASRAGESSPRDSDLERVAKLVLDREIRQATSRALIEKARPCAIAVEAALRDRSQSNDGPGALSAIVLYEADLAGRSILFQHTEDADGAWRAARARAFVRPSDFEARRRAISDPDERVRRQALRAAMQAPHDEDAEAVLEAARLDPSPSVRESAFRAAGAIGGEKIVSRLRDLYASASDADRRAIVEALGMPRAFQTGGRAELVRIVETESGTAALLAAATLVRLHAEGASSFASLLSRAIRDGSARHRAMAIRLAPLGSEAVLAALRATANDPDEAVQVAALARLLESPPDRVSALEHLAALAEARQQAAAFALARAGDGRAIPHLVERLESSEPSARSAAGEALVDAGDPRGAARLLTDEDANVRTAVACRLLTSLGD